MNDHDAISTITFSPFNQRTEKTYSLTGSRQTFNSKKFSASQYKNVLERLNQGIDRYLEFLRSSIDHCINGKLDKVIASRAISLKGVLNYKQLFIQLLNEYPDCFVYLFETDDEVFMGATPELLLACEGGIVKSVALAGTMKVPEGETLDSWKKKEWREHQIVEDYIKSNFEKHCQQISVSEKTVKVNGPVCHLNSFIDGELNSISSAIELKDLIHPTPAVCGLPKNSAFNFILENEGYQRRYYCGNIGVADEQKEDYYVNLRCLSYKDGLTKIYVGGGITSDSDYLMEYNETELKSKVLLDIIAKIHSLKSDNE